MSDNDKTVPSEDANPEIVETTTTEEAPVEQTQETTTEVKETPAVETEEKPKEVDPVERKVYSMPVAKAQEEKKKAVEKAQLDAEEKHTAELTKIKADFEEKLKNASPAEVSDELKKVSEKHGLDPQATQDLMNAFSKSIKLPDTSKYDQLIKDQEVAGHKTAVSKEFDEKVAPLILKDNPQATPEYIREVKAKIEELAFTEGYNTYQLTDIYTIKKNDLPFKNGMSAESPGGRGPDLVAFKKLSDEDEIKLADRDSVTYEKYLNWLRGQESQYLN